MATRPASNELAVSVVIPAYNEARAVAPQVNAVRQVLCAHDIVHEIIVVDDGSEDDTADAAHDAGARVLRSVENRGYGAAIKTGVLAAQHQAIVIIDADGTYPADEIPALLKKLPTADMVVGARTGDHVRIPKLRRPAKWLLGKLAEHIAGRRIPDLNSGLRAFWRDCVHQYFPILSNRFSFTTTSTLALLADDYRVVYHPINYLERIGRSKIQPRHFLDFCILVLRMSMIFQPLRVFVPLALGCVALGLAKGAWDVGSLFARHSAIGWHLAFEPALSTSAIMLLTAGLQFLFVGMVADGVLRRIAQHNQPLVPSHGRWVLDAVGSTLHANGAAANGEERALRDMVAAGAVTSAPEREQVAR